MPGDNKRINRVHLSDSEKELLYLLRNFRYKFFDEFEGNTDEKEAFKYLSNIIAYLNEIEANLKSIIEARYHTGQKGGVLLKKDQWGVVSDSVILSKEANQGGDTPGPEALKKRYNFSEMAEIMEDLK